MMLGRRLPFQGVSWFVLKKMHRKKSESPAIPKQPVYKNECLVNQDKNIQKMQPFSKEQNWSILQLIENTFMNGWLFQIPGCKSLSIRTFHSDWPIGVSTPNWRCSISFFGNKYPRKWTARPWETMVGRLLFWWDGPVLGAMLNFSNIRYKTHKYQRNIYKKPVKCLVLLLPF